MPLRRSTSTHVFVLAAAAVFVLGACGTRAEPGGTDTTAAPGAGPLVGSWALVSYQGPSGAVAAATGAAPATLTFGEPPSLSGSTGCNDFGGTYSTSGGGLSLALGPMTQRACTDPAATAQESALVDGLGRVASARVSGERLTLADSSGSALFEYQRAASGLAGTRWVANAVNNGAGAVEGTDQTPNLNATFGTDARVTGSGGCNDFTAAYTEGPGTISISALASTEMSCGAEVDTLEQRYFAALQASTTFEVRGDLLTLRDGTGAMQVVFNRAP